LGVVDAALTGRDFLVGEAFTAADVMMGYSLALLDSLKALDRVAFARTAAYLDRLKRREPFRRATSV
jgi:glutathione S-transferase